MEELKVIAELLGKMVNLFGSTLTTILVLAFIYFRYLRKGGILTVTNGKKYPCDERLKLCGEQFEKVHERLDNGDKEFKEQNKIINETHTNVAVLLERTNHLKRRGDEL